MNPIFVEGSVASMLAGIAQLHFKHRDTKPVRRILLEDGEYRISPSTKVGAKMGWRGMSRRLRGKMGWAEWKRSRRQMRALEEVSR